ncbi:MAG: hypothetical protein HQ582_21135, partial [Planctomycetes bacterium]|nr:hypothetical protein [Planctomycetota bacterium]
MQLIQPRITLSDVFGPEPVFNPRGSFHGYGWLHRELSTREFATGGVLSTAGSTPTICSSAVASPAGLDLLADAGLPPAGPLLTYTDEAEYSRRIAEVIEAGKPIVMQHVQRSDETPPESYWMARSLLAFLNNKGNLAELAPQEALPSRRLVKPTELAALARTHGNLPLAVKAATNRSTGGGFAVILARSPDDLNRASKEFGGCRRVVVEEFLDIRENFCLNFAATDREIFYLGAAEQVVDAAGAYRGNWYEPHRQPPAEAVRLGREIMRQAALRGYRGFAGFDMAVLFDGRVKVFDLNFRLNGCTKVLLLYEGVRRAFGARCIGRGCSFQAAGSFLAMCNAARAAFQERVLLPLVTYDPAAIPVPTGAPMLWALVLGEDRPEVEAKLGYL